MLFTWIEDTEQIELLDENGNVFVPSQYKTVGTGSGVMTGLNRKAVTGEQQGTISPAERVHGMEESKYKVVNYKAVPKSMSVILSIEFNRKKQYKQTSYKQYCQNLIYSEFPAAVQSSMALGIYPAAEVTRMTGFIAACIEEENRLHDAVELATTLAELETITPNWPELI